MGQFVFFFDRRTWSSSALSIEVESADEALRLYQEGGLDGCLEKVAWDQDDVEVTLVAIEERDTPS